MNSCWYVKHPHVLSLCIYIYFELKNNSKKYQMIKRNFTAIQNTVINTVMSYKTCRQVLNKYYIAPLNTSCLTIEYIFIFVKAIYTMLQI